MTPNQAKALDYYRERISVADLPPTLEEVAGHVGVSRAGAGRIVDALVEMKYLRRLPHKRRGTALAGHADLRHVGTADLQAELARRGAAIGAFAEPERRAFWRGAVTCAADCCDIEVKIGHAFCRTHWFMIEPATRNALLHAHSIARATRRAEHAADYQDVFARAQQQITNARRAL